MPDEPYSRLYHRFPREFPDVWEDSAMFGAWARLLMIADAAYPSPAPFPRWITDDVIAVLQVAGLVEPLPGDTFTVRGLEGERERRVESARKAGLASAEARRQRTGNDRSTPVQRGSATGDGLDETRRDEDETSGDETSGSREGWFEVVREAERLTGRPYVIPAPQTRMGEQVADLIARHGSDVVIATFKRVASALDKAPTIQQLVFGTRDALDRIPRVAPESEHERSVREAKALAAKMGAKP